MRKASSRESSCQNSDLNLNTQSRNTSQYKTASIRERIHRSGVFENNSNLYEEDSINMNRSRRQSGFNIRDQTLFSEDRSENMPQFQFNHQQYTAKFKFQNKREKLFEQRKNYLKQKFKAQQFEKKPNFMNNTINQFHNIQNEIIVKDYTVEEPQQVSRNDAQVHVSIHENYTLQSDNQPNTIIANSVQNIKIKEEEVTILSPGESNDNSSPHNQKCSIEHPRSTIIGWKNDFDNSNVSYGSQPNLNFKRKKNYPRSSKSRQLGATGDTLAAHSQYMSSNGNSSQEIIHMLPTTNLKIWSPKGKRSNKNSKLILNVETKEDNQRDQCQGSDNDAPMKTMTSKLEKKIEEVKVDHEIKNYQYSHKQQIVPKSNSRLSQNSRSNSRLGARSQSRDGLIGPGVKRNHQDGQISTFARKIRNFKTQSRIIPLNQTKENNTIVQNKSNSIIGRIPSPQIKQNQPQDHALESDTLQLNDSKLGPQSTDVTHRNVSNSPIRQQSSQRFEDDSLIQNEIQMLHQKVDYDKYKQRSSSIPNAQKFNNRFQNKMNNNDIRSIPRKSDAWRIYHGRKFTGGFNQTIDHLSQVQRSKGRNQFKTMTQCPSKRKVQNLTQNPGAKIMDELFSNVLQHEHYQTLKNTEIANPKEKLQFRTNQKVGQIEKGLSQQHIHKLLKKMAQQPLLKQTLQNNSLEQSEYKSQTKSEENEKTQDSYEDRSENIKVYFKKLSVDNKVRPNTQDMGSRIDYRMMNQKAKLRLQRQNAQSNDHRNFLLNHKQRQVVQPQYNLISSHRPSLEGYSLQQKNWHKKDKKDIKTTKIQLSDQKQCQFSKVGYRKLSEDTRAGYKNRKPKLVQESSILLKIKDHQKLESQKDMKRLSTCYFDDLQQQQSNQNLIRKNPIKQKKSNSIIQEFNKLGQNNVLARHIMHNKSDSNNNNLNLLALQNKLQLSPRVISSKEMQENINEINEFNSKLTNLIDQQYNQDTGLIQQSLDQEDNSIMIEQLKTQLEQEISQKEALQDMIYQSQVIRQQQAIMSFKDQNDMIQAQKNEERKQENDYNQPNINNMIIFSNDTNNTRYLLSQCAENKQNEIQSSTTYVGSPHYDKDIIGQNLIQNISPVNGSTYGISEVHEQWVKPELTTICVQPKAIIPKVKRFFQGDQTELEKIEQREQLNTLYHTQNVGVLMIPRPGM